MKTEKTKKSEQVKAVEASLDRTSKQHPELIDHSIPKAELQKQWEQTLKGALIDESKLVYTLEEAAVLFSVHKETLRRAIKKKQLKAAFFGKEYRLSRVELKRYWESLGGGQLFGDDSGDRDA